jgi:hypothetical protein
LFWIERKQHNECRLVCRYFAKLYKSMVCLKFYTDQGSHTSEVHTNVLLNNGIKISMDGKGRAIDNILLKDYGGQSNTRMYIYSIYWRNQPYRGLKDYFEFYNTRRLHQSLDYGTPYNNYYKRRKIRITFLAFKIAKSYSDLTKIIEYQTKNLS